MPRFFFECGAACRPQQGVSSCTANPVVCTGAESCNFLLPLSDFLGPFAFWCGRCQTHIKMAQLQEHKRVQVGFCGAAYSLHCAQHVHRGVYGR